MLAASHVLAVDSKNLLDVIDEVRISHGIAKHSNNSGSSGGSQQ